MTIFKKNSKKNVKNEFIRSKISIENFKQLIEKCIRIDDIFYNRIMKKRYENSYEKLNIYANEVNFRNKRSYFKNKFSY